MNSDSYKIILSISHHRIAYEYWQRDGENKLVPVSCSRWPAPLAFYCSKTGVIVGEEGARAARSGIENAFGNYFELLVSDRNYPLGGQRRPIRYLILDASELIFRDTFQVDFLNQYGSSSNNRADMPLTIVCESDILPNERALLQKLFRDSGYARVRAVDYNNYIARYIREYLSKNYVCDNVVVAWSEDANLTLTLFDVKEDVEPRQTTLEGLGTDPRKEYVKDLIWESVINENPFYNRNDVDDALDKGASDFLNSNLPMLRDKIICPDGRECPYSLIRNNIDYIQSDESTALRDKLEEFLRSNGITNRSRSLLLLRGNAAGNSYFEQNLSQGFSKTIKTDRRLRESIMQYLISEVHPPIGDPHTATSAPEGTEDLKVLKEKQKKWREIRADAKGKKRSGHPEIAIQILKSFMAECESVSGADDIISEINELTDQIASETIKQAGADTPKSPVTDIKQFKDEWIDIRREARARKSNGNTTEAIDLLKSFRSKISKKSGMDELIASVDKELDKYDPSDSSQKPPRQPVDEGKIKPKDKPVTVRTDPAKIDGSTADTYISLGKFTEAREWYKTHNDTRAAKKITDLIRSQKEIVLREKSLNQYRKSKNQEQINRIISEIQAYIKLCEELGADSAKYKKLLSEYKKI